ncbi:MAG: hypothetical protein KF729_08920 [Sandaracinaceae bacterium]|nr:hypothetical protein [Sandaracinaceae bacterium]
MPSRLHDRRNPNIQWFDPPVALENGRARSSPWFFDPEEGRSLEPELWSVELGLALDRVASSRVGRAIVDCVRRRTTIYATHGGAYTDPDPFVDQAGVEIPNARLEAAMRDATTIGADALIGIDLIEPAVAQSGAEVWAPYLALLHELVHAVNITWGNYRVRAMFAPTEANRVGAPSPEEEMALLIDNIHRSERGLWIRRRYDSAGPLLRPGTIPRNRSMGIDVTRSEARVVSRCERRVPILAARLAALDRRTCPYNPFRDRGGGASAWP